jgi:hypothetical protein
MVPVLGEKELVGCVIRWVQVRDLPEGYFRERLTSMCEIEDAYVCVIAKPGHCEDWSAYIGWPRYEHLTPEMRVQPSTSYYCTSVRLPIDVMHHGDKLSADEAIALFPGMHSWFGSKGGYRP